MDFFIKRKLRTPWRDGLIIATGLSALAFAASLLWQSGQAEWGFVLMFGTTWLLISLLLINDGFNEESGLMLARLLDHNVDHLLARVDHLEKALALRNEPEQLQPKRASSAH